MLKQKQSNKQTNIKERMEEPPQTDLSTHREKVVFQDVRSVKVGRATVASLNQKNAYAHTQVCFIIKDLF